MLAIHPSTNKMYQDLKQRFWWTHMKREIARYVAECDVCQKVKVDQLKICWNAATLTNPSMEMGRHSHGFYSGPSSHP